MSINAPIRIIIADDQAMVRAGFAALLGAQPEMEVVAQVDDGAEAVTAVAALRPDVVVMDVRMPVLDGIEATRQIAAAQADGAATTRVLMLTTFDIDDYVYEALRAGASGFLLKDAHPEELVRAVRTVAAGEALLAPRVTRRMIEHFARQAPVSAGPRAQIAALTEREHEVLVLLARGLSNQEIAAHLVLAEQTVKTHVSRVFGKIGARDRAQAVVFAYEAGVVIPASPA